MMEISAKELADKLDTLEKHMDSLNVIAYVKYGGDRGDTIVDEVYDIRNAAKGASFLNPNTMVTLSSEDLNYIRYVSEHEVKTEDELNEIILGMKVKEGTL
ncbi:hypothetical protein VPBG_00140 [Vibrio phage helene 12B3]|uniref:hypothetical protein n=1 Tax=Vibrio phage helene 12B3 TaxID=573173 RepID=UPI0002C08D90|nr:hypothetical protein VPBG_00140 [Vibrio phage helene 12B3]AGG57912.1 hypothetical protein VPBG_00140 [Vibrio phage helene 12B3]